MSRYIAIFLISILAVSLSAQRIFKVPLTKYYADNMMLSDDFGKFYMNPHFDHSYSFREIDEEVEAESQIINQGNLLYYGSLWFSLAGDATELQVIFDTGSSWLWTNVEGCTGCPSSETLPTTQYYGCMEDKSLGYGSGRINGQICFTTVSPSPDAGEAVTGMKMIAVNAANLPGIQNTVWDGIVGLLPTTSSGSDLFVQVMKDQGIIDTAAFGVHYGGEKYGSEITFGGIDTDRVPHFDNLTFTDLYSHSYWSVGITSIKYGDVEVGGKAIRGLIDTGSSLLMLPTEDYKRWEKEVYNEHECGSYGAFKGCYCDGVDTDEMFDPIYFTFDNYEYRITPDNYVVRANTQGREFCYFLVGELKGFKSIPTVVLGDTFIRNYYVYHDMENGRIGLYGDHMVYHESKMNPKFIIGIAIVVVVVIIVGVVLFLCTRESGDQEEKDKQLLEPEGVELNNSKNSGD